MPLFKRKPHKYYCVFVYTAEHVNGYVKFETDLYKISAEDIEEITLEAKMLLHKRGINPNFVGLITILKLEG